MTQKQFIIKQPIKMTKLQKYGGVLALVALVLAIGAYYFPQVTTIIQKGGSISTEPTTNFPSLGTKVFGLGTGCDDGFATCVGPISTGVGQAMIVSSTTPCAMQNPFNASTTATAWFQLNTGTSTATKWTVSSSTDAFSTTTGMSFYSVASGKQFTSTTSTAIVAPSGWIVIGVANAGGTSDGISGICRSKFEL